MKMLRDVTTDECGWLNKDMKKGDIVYRYYGCTYGCIGPKGIAVSIKEGTTPFFEIPLDSIGE